MNLLFSLNDTSELGFPSLSSIYLYISFLNLLCRKSENCFNILEIREKCVRIVHANNIYKIERS